MNLYGKWLRSADEMRLARLDDHLRWIRGADNGAGKRFAQGRGIYAS